MSDVVSVRLHLLGIRVRRFWWALLTASRWGWSRPGSGRGALCPTRATCSTASTWRAGSPKVSPWYAERYNAVTPSDGPQHTNTGTRTPKSREIAQPQLVSWRSSTVSGGPSTRHFHRETVTGRG